MEKPCENFTHENEAALANIKKSATDEHMHDEPL